MWHLLGYVGIDAKRAWSSLGLEVCRCGRLSGGEVSVTDIEDGKQNIQPSQWNKCVKRFENRNHGVYRQKAGVSPMGGCVSRAHSVGSEYEEGYGLCQK